jgi:hypothetical protein
MSIQNNYQGVLLWGRSSFRKITYPTVLMMDILVNIIEMKSQMIEFCFISYYLTFHNSGISKSIFNFLVWNLKAHFEASLHGVGNFEDFFRIFMPSLILRIPGILRISLEYVCLL